MARTIPTRHDKTRLSHFGACVVLDPSHAAWFCAVYESTAGAVLTHKRQLTRAEATRECDVAMWN